TDEQCRGRTRPAAQRLGSRPQTALTRWSDAQPRMVGRNGGAVRGRDRSLAHVAALRGGGLQTQDLDDGCFEVLLQSFLGEGDLSDDEVQVRLLVDAEFDLSALDVGH